MLDRVRRLLAEGNRARKRLVGSRLGVRRIAGRLTWRRRRRPDFLILGAQKAGTTSLFALLCACPSVRPPERFELHYFDREFWRGLAWYLSHFPLEAGGAGEEVVTGEKSPYYLFHPFVPSRVRAVLPDCRFLVLLRNPVERTYSHFQHSREQGFETVASFREAVEREAERLAGEEVRLEDPRYVSFAHQHHSYFQRSVYADQLERWFGVFPRERFLILQSERLFDDPATVLAQTFGFLGIEGREATGLHRRNVGSYAPLAPEDREWLQGRFEPHNERLFRLLGRRFDWSR